MFYAKYTNDFKENFYFDRLFYSKILYNKNLL